MLSRRIIRVKVMQTLYALQSTGSEIRFADGIGILKKNLEQSRQLFTYLVYIITEVARFAESDALQKSSKHLPSRSDLNINTKVSGNEIVWALLTDETFKKAVDDYKVKNLVDPQIVKQLYDALVGSGEYQLYTSVQSRDKRSEKKIMEFIFTGIMLSNDNFINHLEENFMHWEDDAEMMITLMTNFFQRINKFNFGEMLTPEKWDFAKDLLECVINKHDYCMELIKPKLKNWDAERIAALDMILMQMGVCEFLYFETIPPKVTINEYIDLAKDYSTPQSGHFVNGILDNIHKELMAENKIHKKNFRNSTL
jgi:transcription antitermination protein NusB